MVLRLLDHGGMLRRTALADFRLHGPNRSGVPYVLQIILWTYMDLLALLRTNCDRTLLLSLYGYIPFPRSLPFPFTTRVCHTPYVTPDYCMIGLLFYFYCVLALALSPDTSIVSIVFPYCAVHTIV